MQLNFYSYDNKITLYVATLLAFLACKLNLRQYIFKGIKKFTFKDIRQLIIEGI